jgi:sugar/nucleoside kinase (ribokinase family)
VTAAISARVGDDIFGRFAIETLRGRGVDCSALKTDPTQPTSQTLIVNVRGQDRRFIHTIGANRGFVAEDLDVALATAPRILHIGYFLILPKLDADGLAARFRRARAAGTMTLLDVATPGPGQYLDRLRVVLPETDIFVPNTDEAELILGESDPVLQARAFREMGARRVVITLGERGVVSLSDELEVRLGVYPTAYVDGSGGGDAFNAGYIVGLLEGRPELECLKLASAVGASCVRAVGTTEGVFTRQEADAFIGRHEVAAEPIA